MKTISTQSIKAIRHQMKVISACLGSISIAETTMLASRNCREWDNAQRDCQLAFEDSLEALKEMLKELELIGSYHGAVDVHDFYTIEKKNILEVPVKVVVNNSKSIPA